MIMALVVSVFMSLTAFVGLEHGRNEFDRGYKMGFAEAGPIIERIENDREKFKKNSARGVSNIELKNSLVFKNLDLYNTGIKEYAQTKYRGETIIGDNPKNLGVWRQKSKFTPIKLVEDATTKA